MPDPYEDVYNLLQELLGAVNAYRDEHSNREAEGTMFPYLNNYPRMLIAADKVAAYFNRPELKE
jgi:hypothetical protein